MIRYLIAFLLIASPCLAGMGIGGFPQPGPGVVVGGGECSGTTFCWLAESTTVEKPTTTASLDGTTPAEIVSGGYSGNMVETNNDASGRAAISISSSDLSEGVGRFDAWIKNNASAGSTTQRYVFEALGQTGLFAISITHVRVSVLYGSSTVTLDTAANYLQGGLRHLVVTWDDANDTVTIDVDEGTYSTTNTSVTDSISGDATSIVIAGRSGTTGYVSADEIKVYNTTN